MYTLLSYLPHIYIFDTVVYHHSILEFRYRVAFSIYPNTKFKNKLQNSGLSQKLKSLKGILRFITFIHWNLSIMEIKCDSKEHSVCSTWNRDDFYLWKAKAQWLTHAEQRLKVFLTHFSIQLPYIGWHFFPGFPIMFFSKLSVKSNENTMIMATKNIFVMYQALYWLLHVHWLTWNKNIR